MYFRPAAAAAVAASALSDNWVLRFNALKRLYKLLIRYFEYVLFRAVPCRAVCEEPR